MAPQKINIKERFTDGEIDLSMSDLQDVPVKEIAVFKKAQSLDLSNNHLKTLPASFTNLTHLTKLDLSKNQLTELPENFGDLVKLKYLDLYQNKLQYLPLSFSKLKQLKWLDLKDNPLVPAVAKVSGPCLDAKQCQACAKDVVNFFTQVQEQIDSDIENRQKQRQKQLELKLQKEMENKKNKKKEKSKLQQKKENGPAKEPAVKQSKQKNKKSAVAEKQQKKPSSLFKPFFGFVSFTFLVLFISTSVKWKHTLMVEKTCVDLYDGALKSLAPNLQVYWLQMGSYVKYSHDKTGNITLQIVDYVKNTDNFINAYKMLGEQIENLLQRVKEQYKKYTS